MKRYNRKEYIIYKSRDLKIECWTEDTRYGFRHLAELNEGRYTIETAKACYYNRTWERYDYQSVIYELIDKAGLKNAVSIKKRIDAQALGQIDREFKGLAAVMAVGELIAGDQAQANSIKLTALKSKFGAGLILPDDWDQLPEDTKTERLNNIEQLLTEGV